MSVGVGEGNMVLGTVAPGVGAIVVSAATVALGSWACVAIGCGSLVQANVPAPAAIDASQRIAVQSRTLSQVLLYIPQPPLHEREGPC